MRRRRSRFVSLLLLTGCVASGGSGASEGMAYQDARWNPIHFKPAIDTATDQQCLACHKEILDQRSLQQTPAGVNASEALAWYQTLYTYEGEQETFHRRHLVTDYANKVMALKCNSCHQGNDPREETAGSSANADPTLTQRKHVDPNICLMCHGQFPYQVMGVPGDWRAFGHLFNDSCLTCHANFRTSRHQVNFLKPEAIEAVAQETGDVCFGCHGGRSWYRISFPYARHPWPGMPEALPEWADGRPTQSDPRFLVGLEDKVDAEK